MRNKIDVRLVSNEIKTKLYVTKIADNDLVATRKSKVTLALNKPAFAEMCILDLTKVLMYEFHYDFIKTKFGNNSSLLLLFTDTNSLRYEL